MEYYYTYPFVSNPQYSPMYRNENIMQPDPYTYPDNFPEAIKLIEVAITGEKALPINQNVDF